MENILSKEQFLSLLEALDVPSFLNRDFLYESYVDAKESSSSFGEKYDAIARLDINDVALTLYLVNEHLFYLTNHGDKKQEEVIKDDEYETFLLSIVLDKYYTNEHLAYRNSSFSNRFNPDISTISLFLNFILGMLERYKKGYPKETLIIDVMQKGFSMAQCITSLLIGGFETEAFSTWRTLHENECILLCLVRHGQSVIDSYLRHLQYAIAFRGGISSKEETDRVFESIKSEMRSHDLKSKDMKRFIEYGWLYAIDGLAKDEEFKLNFRDGVERAANLRQYAKVYEMSSEIAHSSPLLIYSRKDYFSLVTLLNLYESFFRLEKVFSSLYLSSVTKEAQESYLRMQNLYHGELLASYDFVQRRLAKMNRGSQKQEND